MKKIIYLALMLLVLIAAVQNSFADSCTNCKDLCCPVVREPITGKKIRLPCEPTGTCTTTCETANLANSNCSSNAVCQVLKATEPSYYTLADAWQYAYDMKKFNSKGECENIAKTGNQAADIICNGNVYCQAANFAAKQENLCFCRYEIDYWRNTPPTPAPKPTTAKVRGTVIGPANQYAKDIQLPVANKQVLFKNLTKNTTYVAITDAKGKYNITIPLTTKTKFHIKCNSYLNCGAVEWQRNISPGDNIISDVIFCKKKPE